VAKVNLWVPDELQRAMLEQLPDDFNLSALFQEALQHKLRGSASCTHELVSCVVCSRSGTPAELVAAAQHRAQQALAAQQPAQPPAA
jgi:hypothetical protein